MKFIKNFFDKNENYLNAKKSLNKIKKGFEGFVMAFPDITSDEIIFIKNKWEILPNKIARGVKVMILNFNKKFKTLLIEYKPNAYIKPHKHTVEYENGTIIRGSIVNNLTGITYSEGDSYKFSPNEMHYLYSKHGCLIHLSLGLTPNHSLKPLPKKLAIDLKVVNDNY